MMASDNDAPNDTPNDAPVDAPTLVKSPSSSFKARIEQYHVSVSDS